MAILRPIHFYHLSSGNAVAKDAGMKNAGMKKRITHDDSIPTIITNTGVVWAKPSLKKEKDCMLEGTEDGGLANRSIRTHWKMAEDIHSICLEDACSIGKW